MMVQNDGIFLFEFDETACCLKICARLGCEMTSKVYEMNVNELSAEYSSYKLGADAFLAEFMHQLSALIKKADVKLGVPLEGRVKEWASITNKLDGKTENLKSCKDLEDFIGVRVITLFKRDVVRLCKLFEKTFLITLRKDKMEELEVSRFGYISQHLIVRIPKSWKKMPAFSGMDFIVEIQVRTLSQHIWAASSHLLQYKKETDVPVSVSRSIHRVAALLETVDLEFERVLDEREIYTKSSIAINASASLDTDNIQILLKEMFPIENLEDGEDYSELLSDLAHFNVSSVEALKLLWKKHHDAIMAEETKQVKRRKGKRNPIGTSRKRIDKGVFLLTSGWHDNC